MEGKLIRLEGKTLGVLGEFVNVLECPKCNSRFKEQFGIIEGGDCPVCEIILMRRIEKEDRAKEFAEGLQ